jgi:hypothetical protein
LSLSIWIWCQLAESNAAATARVCYHSPPSPDHLRWTAGRPPLAFPLNCLATERLRSLGGGPEPAGRKAARVLLRRLFAPLLLLLSLLCLPLHPAPRVALPRLTMSSPTSPWTTISSSPCGFLDRLLPVANLPAKNLAAFLRSTPNRSSPWMCVATLRFVRISRLIVIWG